MECVCLFDSSYSEKCMNDFIQQNIDKTKDYVVVYSNGVCVGSNINYDNIKQSDIKQSDIKQSHIKQSHIKQCDDSFNFSEYDDLYS